MVIRSRKRSDPPETREKDGRGPPGLGRGDADDHQKVQGLGKSGRGKYKKATTQLIIIKANL